jgi:hypothetical protein
VAAFCRVLLKEIEGTARKRVLIPMIGLGFDRAFMIETLGSMIAEIGGAPSE